MRTALRSITNTDRTKRKQRHTVISLPEAFHLFCARCFFKLFACFKHFHQ